MKVLVVPTWYPNGADKLIGGYHKEFTGALNKYGIEANMLYIDRIGLSLAWKYPFMKKKEKVRETNYDVYLHKMLDVRKLSFDYQLKRYVKKLDKSLKEYIDKNGKPDILHAMMTVPAGYASCIVGEKYGIAVVVTEHGGKFERFFTRNDLKEYGKYVLDHVTYSTVSTYMRDIALKYTDKCFVLPNQLDTKVFETNIKRELFGTFNLVIVSALREGKNVDTAFRAIKILANRGMKVHLDVVGDGFLEEKYKRDCHEIGVDDYVTFRGRLTKPEIAKLFESEHALLITSEIESFGIPGVEAFASGLPVISTDCLGPRDYIDEKSGIICKVDDPDDMAISIERLYRDYDKYDPEYIKSIASKYSEENIIKIAKNIYDVAIDKK